MSADPIVYCLERVTDYRQFERLATDLMAGAKYADIEPFGGSNDRGRDALFKSAVGTTIFAYSVRRDWLRKLFEDCERIQEERHELRELVFVCTTSITAGEKDEALEKVKSRYGWSLELYDLERLRVMLATTLRHLVAQHPAIFCPPFFPSRGGLSSSPSADTLIIDHALADHALASWLSNRLSLAGFNTWCYGLAPLAGEDADRSVRTLIEMRAIQYLPILSPAAVSDSQMMSRCDSASVKDDFLIPCVAQQLATQLSPRLQALSPARFDRGFAQGLRDVLACLEGRGVKPPRSGQPAALSLHSHLSRALIKREEERVVANVFSLKVPASIFVIRLTRDLRTDEVSALRRKWAFVLAGNSTLFAFLKPPAEVPYHRDMLAEHAWDGYQPQEGKTAVDIVKELSWRSLDIACEKAGLVWCEHRRLYYFPHEGENANRFVAVRHLDGQVTRVSVTGEVQYGYGERASRVRYQLAPRFSVSVDDAGAWWATLRLYVRVTTTEGIPFEGKDIGRRRKAVTKGWWNRQWLLRTLGVIQALKDPSDPEIAVGYDHRQVILSVRPLEWVCPVAIDGEAVDQLGEFQEEFAEQFGLDDEDDSVEQEDEESTEPTESA